MTDSAVTGGSEPFDLLPIPTDDYPDIGAALRAKVSDLKPGIDVLVGPDDAGKSALLRILAMDYQAVSHSVRFFDLSITSWKELVLGEVNKAQIILIDHLDRVNDPDHFTVAYDILDRVIPTIFARGSFILLLSLGQEWRDTFRAAYRMNPETLLKRSMPNNRGEPPLHPTLR